MYSLKRLIALAALTAFAAGTLTACNTVEGAGKDVKHAGSSIERKAKEEKAEHRAEERRDHDTN
jgi:predicted small secreted protein